MGYGRRKTRKYYSLVVVVLLLVGTVAAAFAYFRGLQGPCQDPNYQASPPTVSGGPVAYNSIIFNTVNATFHRQGQVVVIGDVTFRNLVPIDPSLLRQIGPTCVIDNTQPLQLLFEASFQIDGDAEPLQVQYGGPTISGPTFTQHTSPQAGVSWYPGDTHLVLWARE